MKTLAMMVLALAAAACQKSQPAVDVAPPAGAGVSVDTGKDVLPLSAFSLGIAHVLPVRNVPHAVPQVPGVKAFIVNVPNVTSDDLKVYWVRDLDLIFSANQEPIPAQVSKKNGAVFEVSPGDLTESGGYLMLVIGSAHGGPSRYYAVALHS